MLRQAPGSVGDEPGSLSAIDTKPNRSDAVALRQALAFTELHRDLAGAPRGEREARCLAAQYPAILLSIREGDLFAGRVHHAPVGFSPEPGGFGYYCDEAALREAAAGATRAERAAADAAIDYWRERTSGYRVRAAYGEELARRLPSDDWCGEAGVGFPLYRLAGVYLDFAKLIRLGLSGLRAEVEGARRRGAEADWVDGMLGALDVVAASCWFYADAALRAQLEEMAAVLSHVAEAPPRTLREALQLSWIYALVAGVLNYGRMDVAFGPLLAADLESGRLDEPQALALLESLWRLMAARRTIYNSRVIVGGLGRPDASSADRFAHLAIEATRRVTEVEPQLTLRFHEGMDPELIRRAHRSIGEGRTYPMLYNDDVNVPAVQKAFGVSQEEAEQYLPFGCGEYVLEHRSVGTPNGVINLLKALEVTLHGGRDALSGEAMGLRGPRLEDFDSFEALFAAYGKQVEHHVEALAEQEALEYRVLAGEAHLLLLGLLHDDCLSRCRPLLEGGVRYLGGTLETYGNISASDSLAAIKALVFDERRIEPGRLRAALAADFEGFEAERQLLRQAPKYGNDDEAADGMAQEVHEQVCGTTREQAERFGLDSYLIVIINNHANTVLGRLTAASADGRRSRQPMNNGNNPSSGADRSGTTAFLSSLVKLDPSLHAGSVQNIKFGKEMFGARLPVTEALLRAYFDTGGTQAMISVVGREELESALHEPEMWGHLMVRVGGFSARFVELPPGTQREILERTLN